MDWSELHEDYLHQILKKFTSVSDCLRFGSVCVPWRNFFVPHLHPDLLNPQLPLLLIPTPPPSSSTTTTAASIEKEQTRSFYSVSEKRVYKDLEINLPYNNACGSTHGWIITAGEEDTGFAIELINPFVSINNDYLKIQLPSLTEIQLLPDYPYHDDIFDNHDIFDDNSYLVKAVLSANPLTHPKDYVMMASYLKGSLFYLAFWKPGDQVWNPVPFKGVAALLDVIHHKGSMFYIVNSTKGKVYICDLGSADRPIQVRYIATSPIPYHIGGTYLVKLPSSDDLFMMVHRFHAIVHSRHSTVGFSIFKPFLKNKEEEDNKGPYKWRPMRNLENQMVFLGDNTSMCLSASEFPGGKPNHIYFTPDYLHHYLYQDDGYLDMGVYDYRAWSIEQIHLMGSKDYILPTTAIWVEPTLRCCLRI